MEKERPNVTPGGIIGECLAAWPIVMGIKVQDPYQIGIGVAMAAIPISVDFIAQTRFHLAEKRRNLENNQETGNKPKE